MSRFSFSRCSKCDRLNIHGATCVCGQRTDRPATTHRPETTTDAREANPHG